MKDYYATIKHPLSIKGAQKLVRGIKGREKHTGTTFLDTWQEFDEEVSHIWNNARLYNEDESEISKLAGKLEKYFNMRVQTAKKAVPDPVVPKLKISVSKQAETSGKSGFNSTDIPKAAVDEVSRKYGVDEDALRRQKELVANGVVGKLDPSTQASASPAPRATSEVKSTTPNGIAESSGQPLSNGKPRLDTSMPPPSTFPGVQPAVTRPPPPLRSEDIKKPWDTWKRSDRPEQHRWPYHTIKEILIISHPALNLGSRGYRWSLYPWPQFNYASDTIPMRKETSRILFSPLLIKPTRERPVVYHHVTLNGVRLQASSSAPRIPGGQASEEDNLYRPVYDIHLDITDVNELMVECYTCPSEVCDTKDVLFDKHMVNIQPR